MLQTCWRCTQEPQTRRALLHATVSAKVHLRHARTCFGGLASVDTDIGLWVPVTQPNIAAIGMRGANQAGVVMAAGCK